MTAHRCSDGVGALRVSLACVLGAAAPPALAHHGIASLGAIALEGPGAPIETTVSAALPPRSWLGYVKLDRAAFEKFTPRRDDEGDYSNFTLLGLGRGFTPWLTGYAFLPHTSKVLEDNSFNTTGIGDVVLTATVGFKLDDGLRLVPETESLDDWYDWHFSAYAGMTLPTGNAELRDAAGAIDPGQSLGFGEPSLTLGFATTRLLTDRQTLHLDASYVRFREHRYDDGVAFRFGGESRVNAAWVYKLTTNAERRSRWDVSLEANYLALGRDRTAGAGDTATGGAMLYLQPGVRYYVNNLSFAVGLKVPTRTDLNEEDEQQGAEGTEDYRLQLSFSVLF